MYSSEMKIIPATFHIIKYEKSVIIVLVFSKSRETVYSHILRKTTFNFLHIRSLFSVAMYPQIMS